MRIYLKIAFKAAIISFFNHMIASMRTGSLVMTNSQRIITRRFSSAKRFSEIQLYCFGFLAVVFSGKSSKDPL